MKPIISRETVHTLSEECSDLGEAFAAVALRIQGEQKTLLKHLEREFSRIDPMAGQVALYMTMVCVRVFEDGGEAGSVLRRVNQTSIDEATRAVRAQHRIQAAPCQPAALLCPGRGEAGSHRL